MPTTPLVLYSSLAQAAYSKFDEFGDSGSALIDDSGGEFIGTSAARLLGQGSGEFDPFRGGFSLVAHQPDEANGFSTTLFRDKQTGSAVLAIRGTNDLVDIANDVLLVAQGAAFYQLISLYRYYKRLITPEGQAVSYSASDVEVLHSLNLSLPLLLRGVVSSAVTDTGDNDTLDLALASDRGLGVLAPNEQLVVTGHSLGGHLAILFGRAFPSVTEHVFTFNAPGTPFWGDTRLTNAGLVAGDPSRVTNVVSDNGLDMTAALGTKPGETIRVFNEATANPIHNHSIARQSEALALYDLFGALSPTLGLRMNDISAILAASSSKPTETLESALDMLGLALGEDFETDIAVGTSDSVAREEYFSNLYSLRDQYAGAGDWRIVSLAGASSGQIYGAASTAGVRYALSELMPFAVLEQSFDESLQDLSQQWLFARAEFLAELSNTRTADAIFGQSGSKANFTFFDVDRDLRVSLLSAGTAGQALSHGAEEDVRAFLSTFAYDRMTVFGSDYVESPDSLAGSAGGDRFFGGFGNDTLSTLAGDDLIEDGAGADFLVGGMGNDRYLLVDDSSTDRIRDADGEGSVRVGGSLLTGGFEESAGIYVSWDNQHTYAFSGDPGARGTLVVDASLVIENFLNGDLGINLVGVPEVNAEATDYTFTGDREFLQGDVYDTWENRLATGPSNPGYFDYFRNGRPGNTRFELGAGNDAAKDIHGGDDVLILGAGQDYGAGGVGNDWIEGGDDHDYVDGEDGDDVLYAGNPGDDIEGAAPVSTAEAQIFRLDILSGGAGADTIIGSAGHDYIEGGGGSDQILAGSGNDLLVADGRRWESGDEPIFSTDFMLGISNIPAVGAIALLTTPAALLDRPDAGADTIQAGSGNDTVLAGSGDDLVFGGAGADSVLGGAGNDEMHADLGFDTIRGEDGDDLLIGGADGSLLYGDAGNDTLIGTSAAHMLRGGSGADVYEGSFVGYLGDGDTARLAFGQGHSTVLFADGAPPTGITVEFAADVLAEDLVTRQSSSGSWDFWSSADLGAVSFIGDISLWTGLRVKFADGTVWQHSDFAAHADSSPPAPPFYFPPSPGAGEGGGEGGGPAPDPTDSIYYVGAPGRETISDYAGSDMLVFATHRSEDVSVFRSGSDLLLRYEGGEVRLAGQLDASDAIESVIFGGDGVTWDRAALASNATALPETQTGPLGVQVVAPGQAFTFTLDAEVFEGEYAVGETRIEATDMQGGALPSWLSFDAEQGVFSGTPAAADAGVTAVLVALRDESGVVAVAPLVIAVDGAPTDGGGGGTGEPPAAPVSPIQFDDPAPVRAPFTPVIDDFSTPTYSPAQQTASFASAEVGDIDDPVYRSIERLLAAPATLHAPVFLERYEEAVREFRARHPVPAEEPAEPMPTNEEMARYNTLLHAWLDADQRRNAASSHADGGDYGGDRMSYLQAGAGIERLSGGPNDALARPGLQGLPVIQQQPGLREGLVSLGG